MGAALQTGAPQQRVRHSDGDRYGVDADEARSGSTVPGVFVLLIADADRGRAAQLADDLAEHRVQVIICGDGAGALIAVGAEQPDAVLAAAALPMIGGAALTRALAAHTTIPVVVGIGGEDGQAAVEALSAGAAACIAHPYRLKELLPILRAIRPERMAEVRPPLECGALRLDPGSMEVHLSGLLVRMPMREMQLLQLLMTHADRVVTREQIRNVVWGGAAGSNSITVHIQRLRHRLGDDQVNPRLILTVRGVGYRLVPPPARVAR
jgi:DNA-binding response OmpR family regulator